MIIKTNNDRIKLSADIRIGFNILSSDRYTLKSEQNGQILISSSTTTTFRETAPLSFLTMNTDVTTTVTNTSSLITLKASQNRFTLI